MNRKERRAAQRLGRGADVASGDHAQRLFAQALQYHQLGQLPEAERYYRSLLDVKPKHEHSLYNLGILAMQTQRTGLAVEMFAKAVALNDREPQWRYNYAYALQQSGRNDEAIAQYSRAAALKPDYAEAHLNLGNLLFQLERLAEATTCYRQVAELKPNFAETHYNLGNVLALRGQTAEAIDCFERSLALKPLAETHNNLGIALGKDPGRTDEAIEHYQKALALNPRFVQAKNNMANLHAARGEVDKATALYGEIIAAEPNSADAHENLARALIANGQMAAAVPSLVQAVRLRDAPVVRSLFVTGMRGMRSGDDHPGLRDLVLRALTEGWGDPADLANIAGSLIKAGPGTGEAVARAASAWPRRLAGAELFGPDAGRIFEDRLLRAWLETGRVTDLALERFLTMARAALLERAAGATGGGAHPDELRFWASLAQQCFTNDFVFAITQDEAATVARLRDGIVEAIDAGAPIEAPTLLALASFVRLESLPQAARLIERTWPQEVQAVLLQQLVEPQQERKLAAALQRLTPVNDEVSLKVQAQYEQNPYPRWVKSSPPPAHRDDRHRQNPSFETTMNPYGDGVGTEVLIAGCGTGRHVVDIAQRYPQAHILAIDLSLTSLGYAARKTRELAVRNVEYAQADILELGGLGRSFDVIEASGVLHHLHDPFAGWRVLLSLLRPQGTMQVGLYSERARQPIVAARRFMAERGYGPSADDIRRGRQDLVESADAPAKAIVEFGDFYTVSDCRDLLFHVQEHRLTLPQIKAFLEEESLRFLGFDLDLWLLRAYAQQWPSDTTMSNLDQWHIFEQRNPQTFLGMYQFWVQRVNK